MGSLGINSLTGVEPTLTTPIYLLPFTIVHSEVGQQTVAQNITVGGLSYGRVHECTYLSLAAATEMLQIGVCGRYEH